MPTTSRPVSRTDVRISPVRRSFRPSKVPHSFQKTPPQYGYVHARIVQLASDISEQQSSWLQ